MKEMIELATNGPVAPASTVPHQRRKRYGGKNPRRFEDKYKEHGRDAETIAKVVAAGKTPAGTHRPIMVTEILEVLAPAPGNVAADCTLYSCTLGCINFNFFGNIKNRQPAYASLGSLEDPNFFFFF